MIPPVLLVGGEAHPAAQEIRWTPVSPLITILSNHRLYKG
jgi:hypothetical protein